jgi:hypothetical protein
MQKWQSYVNGDPKRQQVLAEALDWVASSQGLTIDAYLAQHRLDQDIAQLKTYFNSVIDWVGSVFIRPPDKEMRGLEWGRLYEAHHGTSYSATKIEARINGLRSDPAVHNSRGIYEYLLGGENQPQLLNIRLFDDKDKRVAYEQQTTKAEANGESNCPLCALGGDNNKARIYKQNEMDADHVTAWSKGGSTSLSNLTMLCVPHNRAKGNR